MNLVSVHPLVDLSLWYHWAIGAVIVLGLPGWFWAGRYLPGLDWPTRLVLTLATGLLLGPVDSLASALSIPLEPWSHTIVLSLAGYFLGRVSSYRGIWRDIEVDLPPLNLRECLGVCAVSVAMAAVLIQGLGAFVVPAHLHDASNHAFLIERIRETGSVSPEKLFAPPYVQLGVPYWLGWHVSAAHIADIGGMPAYIVEWMMAVGATTLLPISTCLLWRVLRFKNFVAVLAGVFLVSNFYMPGGLYSWGGFGALLGFFLVPTTVVFIRSALRNTRGVFTGALLIGLLFAATLQIHASELGIILLLVLLSLSAAGKSSSFSVSHSWRVSVAGVLVLGVVMGLPMWNAAHSYVAHAMDAPTGSSPGLGMALGQMLHYTGGESLALRGLVVLGILWGLLRRGTRPVAVMSLLLLVLYLDLRLRHDGLSKVLSAPYYQQPARVLYLQLFLLPPLMAEPVSELWKWTKMHGHMRWAGAAVLGALLAFAAAPGAAHNLRNLRQLKQLTAFSEDDFHLARKIRNALPPSARIANQINDGSFWARWISGRDFIDPAAWGMTALRGPVNHLEELPWPEDVWSLQRYGVNYLYLSDGVLPFFPHPPLSRATIRKDARFEEILSGEDSSLFLIEWERGKKED